MDVKRHIDKVANIAAAQARDSCVTRPLGASRPMKFALERESAIG